MAGVIQSCNLYPYMELWRVAGKSEVNHKFGGIVSIILVIFVAVVFILKLMEVFAMKTITASTQTQISIDSPFTYLTTFQNDSSMSPFMFAFSFQKVSNPNSFDFSDLSFQGQYVSQMYDSTSNTYLQNSSKMNLEKCTPDHFSNLAGVTQNFVSWGMNNWYCLPLNQKFQLGGHMTGDKKYLAITVTCSSQNCFTSANNSIIVNTFTYNTCINPYNNSLSSSPYIQKYQTVFQSQSSVKNVYNLDVNVLTTDKSLFPFSQIETKRSLKSDESINSYNYFSNIPSTSLVIYRSGKTVTYKRSYYRILDALAYVGGIFNAFLTIFFFMRWYGCLVHQLNFASEYFAIQQIKEIGFCTFLYQSFFNLLSNLGCKPTWQDATKKQQITKTVNRLLDVIYLQRRLEFLENAISILFQKHQLMSLHLIHNLTREEADHNYEKFKFRNRLLLLIKSRIVEEDEGTQSQMQEIFEQNLFPNTHRSLFVVPGSHSLLEPQQNHNQNDRKLVINDLKKRRESPKKNKKIKIPQFKTTPNLEQLQKRQNNQNISFLRQQRSQQLQALMNRTEKTFQQRQVQNDNKEQALDLILQGLVDVKLMFDQAQRQGGDLRSKRIYKKIDQSLKSFLKNAVKNDNISKISDLFK